MECISVTLGANCLKLRPVDTNRQRNDRPLHDIGVLVTRAKDQAGPMIRELEAMGAKVYHIPAIGIEPIEAPEGLMTALENVRSYDALVFTSANGVEIFTEHLAAAGLKSEDLPPAVCVGPATAAAWSDAGGRVESIPEEFSGEGILSRLDPDLEDKSYLILRPAAVRADLGSVLRERGARVDEVILYRTESSRSDGDRLIDLLDRGRIDIVTFTSPSAIKGISEVLGGMDRLVSVVSLCIGPATARAAEEKGLRDIHHPGEYTVDGMLRMLPSLVKGRDKGR